MTTIKSMFEAKVDLFKSNHEAIQGMKHEIARLLKTNGDGNIEIQSLRNKIREMEQEETDYLLSVAPIVREYCYVDASNVASTSLSTTFNFVTVESTLNKGHLFKRYMAEVEKDEEFIKKLAHDRTKELEAEEVSTDTCLDCKDEQLVHDPEGLVCTHCGRVYPMFEMGINNLTFDQRINDITPVYKYMRRNHYIEWLAKLQAKELTDIPEQVINALKVELKKARIMDASLITPKKVKELLKKLKFSKYYEHVPSITNMLTGKAAPKFSVQLEARLRQMFEEIQEPFELYRPKDRSNFLSYGYVLYKFCELLEEDEYLPYLPLLKSFQKLHAQDMIWKQITNHLKWQYIPSV